MLALLVVLTHHAFSQKLVPCSCASESNLKKYGFCDSLRIKVIIPCQFDSVFQYKESVARVMKAGKFGYISAAGATVIPATYDQANDFSEGFALVKKGGKYFYINKQGTNTIGRHFFVPQLALDRIPASMRADMMKMAYPMLEAQNFHDGLVAIADSASSSFSYMDKTGKTAIATRYIAASAFSEGKAFVKETPTGPTKIINKKNETVFELPAEIMPYKGFKNGVAIVRYRPTAQAMKAYNYVNSTGKLLLTEPVTEAGDFVNGLAVISKKDGFMELINPQGKNVLSQPLRYIEPTTIKGIYYYSNTTERGYGLMDVTGKRLTEASYVKFTAIKDTLFLCQPWGSVTYTLLSTKRGDLIGYSRFTEYYWKTGTNMTNLVLTGTNILGDPIELELNPSTGRYMKDGKVIAAKDIIYLNHKKTDATTPGFIQTENETFSLTFPEEMKLIKDSVGQKVFNKSTFYFTILHKREEADPTNFIDRLASSLAANKERQGVERVNKYLGNDMQLPGVTAFTKNGGRFYYYGVKAPVGMYLLFGSYLAADDGIYGKFTDGIIGSIKFK
jgi:hypothetical protein